MAFEVDHWFGTRFAVLALEGALTEGRKLYRAIDTVTQQPVLLIVGYVPFESELPVGVVGPGLPRFVAAGWMPNSHMALAHVPGVALVDVLAQSRELGGELPLEAAGHIACVVGRAVHRLGLTHHVAPVMSSTVRMGFDGEVLHLGSVRQGSGYDGNVETIRIISLNYRRRLVPPEPGLAPEETDPNYESDMRAEVFRLGALLQLLLDNEHPFEAEHPLQQLENLQHARRRALRRDVPAALRELVTRALAPAPADRFAHPLELAEAIERIVPPDDGPAAVKAVACGMFPRLREQQLLELEQLATLDYADLISDAPTAVMDGDVITRNVRPPAHIERATMSFRFDGRVVRVENRLVTNEQMVAFLDDTGITDPTSFVGRIPELADEPAVFIGPADAAAYAAWRGGRLPTEDEWNAMVSLLTVPDVTRVWEWTSTPVRTGVIVRGGPWRNREGAARVDNRSWEDTACADVGFRVFFDGPR